MAVGEGEAPTGAVTLISGVAVVAGEPLEQPVASAKRPRTTRPSMGRLILQV
jgi:hypothetical protein